MIYKHIIRPLLFRLQPETVHHMVVKCLRGGFRIPGLKFLVQKSFQINDPALHTQILGLNFPNKVGLAAGFDKEANVYNHLAAFGFGHIEIGTVNPLPQPGNPKPRLFRLPKDQALINRMGFNNPGLEAFVANLRQNKPEIIIGGNIGKNTLTPNEKALADYLACFEALQDLVDYFVVNVSCPNIKDLSKLADKDNLSEILMTLNNKNNARSHRKPILLKIAPDLSNTQLDEMLEVIETTGIDGIIATNTTTSRQGLSYSPETIQQIGNGGLSGKPLKDKSNETIRYLARKTGGKLPIIGVGGIMSAQDAIDKLNAGAHLVQVYTGFIYEGPAMVKKINKLILQQNPQ